MNDFGHIKGFGFDLDGTLVNSLPGLTQAIDSALSEQGFVAAGQKNVSCWIGNGADILVQRALCWANADVNSKTVAHTRQLFDHYYEKSVETGSELYPHVIETLEQLSKREIPLTLVTNKPSLFVPSLLEQLGIKDYFCVIVGGDDVAQRKPHPAPLYYILSQLGLHAHELLFVGDSRNDIQAGKAAGCRTVGLSYGYNYGESIALSQPDSVLDSFAELLSLPGLVTHL